MTDVLQPDKNSRNNIQLFLATIEDEELRHLLKTNLDIVLEIGAHGISSALDSRAKFYESMNALVDQMMDKLK